MTRHTRTRQIYKFRGVKAGRIINEPIKDAEAFYMGIGDLDASFHKVSLLNRKKTSTKSLLGNYRLQKKLHKFIKEHGGKLPYLWDIVEYIKKNPKLKKKYMYLISTDEHGRIFTHKVGRKTIYGFIDDYDKNRRVYFSKTGETYRA
ncbi:hypothetical protein CHOTACABRAS_8 [Bacillus phage Chotacabras]|nr:hypothetical protein CHOTACABRAS_8 [Bacillus phage Chotacabras]